MSNRRARTSEETLAIAQMRCVTYPVGSWDKRFMRAISSSDTITDKESSQLWRLFIRYRRQINFPAKTRLLALAEKLGAPDLRKVNKAAVEQARIDHMKGLATE